MNKVMLLGNLGRDAEVRYTARGTAVISFSLATTERWTTQSGERQERTEWHQVVYFAKSDGVSEYLRKGKPVFVEGSIFTEEYEKDGQTRRVTRIKADRLQLLGGGDRGESAGRGPVGADRPDGEVSADEIF